MLGLVAGCGSSAPSEADASLGDGAAPTVNGQTMVPVTDRTPRPADRYVLTVRMEMIPVSVPIGMVSRNERLWRYLDEEIADVRTNAALNRNGIRVGRGGVDDWAPVGRLLREMTGQSLVRSRHLAVPGRATPIPLQSADRRQCIFVFNRHGELRGRDYPGGRNVLMLACRVNNDRPDEVLVQAACVVQADDGRVRYVRAGGGLQLKAVPVEEAVEGVEFTVRVGAGQYLVIGPGEASSRSTSAGGRFFVSDDRGLKHETLLVIVPRVYAAQLPREDV